MKKFVDACRWAALALSIIGCFYAVQIALVTSGNPTTAELQRAAVPVISLLIDLPFIALLLSVFVCFGCEDPKEKS